MKVRKSFVSEAVTDWLTLNENIMELNAEEVLFALELENERVSPRKTFLKRLTQRYNGIRGEEVRMELE